MNLFTAGFCAGTMLALVCWQEYSTFSGVMFIFLGLSVALNLWAGNRKKP